MLVNAVQGAQRPSQLITWTDEDDSALSLTGATVTGVIVDVAGNVRAISGNLTPTASAGEFRWDYSAEDVATVGSFMVQFTATFGTAPTPARTYATPWEVVQAYV